MHNFGDHYLYEKYAFWGLLWAQLALAFFATCKLALAARAHKSCSVVITLYLLVLVYSLSMAQTARSAFFLDVKLHYPMLVYEFLDVAAISAYLCIMSVICWLWMDIYLQFSAQVKRRKASTAIFMGADAVVLLWNFGSLGVLRAIDTQPLATFYLNHINAAVECFFMGIAVQRAGHKAKIVIRGLLQTQAHHITRVQYAGVFCCFLRAFSYIACTSCWGEKGDEVL